MAAHIAFFCPISAFGYLPCSFYRKIASRTGCTQSLKVRPLALCHYLNDIELRPPLLLSFQQSNILINRRPAQITNPSQFRNIQLPPLVCRVMPQKCGGQIPGGYLRPSNLFSQSDFRTQTPCFHLFATESFSLHHLFLAACPR